MCWEDPKWGAGYLWRTLCVKENWIPGRLVEENRACLIRHSLSQIGVGGVGKTHCHLSLTPHSALESLLDNATFGTWEGRSDYCLATLSFVLNFPILLQLLHFLVGWNRSWEQIFKVMLCSNKNSLIQRVHFPWWGSSYSYVILYLDNILR